MYQSHGFVVHLVGRRTQVTDELEALRVVRGVRHAGEGSEPPRTDAVSNCTSPGLGKGTTLAVDAMRARAQADSGKRRTMIRPHEVWK